MVTYKMKNLANVLSTADGDDTVLQRMEMLDLARNLLNMVFIDADGEDVGIQSLSVAGVKDILDNACAMLSAVSHIPQTRLFGRSPAGENATGEGDMENYKEAVSGIQSGDLRDNTRTLVELILRGMVWNGEIKEVPEYTITYKSAWSLSDDEKATQDQANAAAQLTRAQTVSTYVTAGILEIPEVRQSLAQDEQFDPENIITEADVNQDWGLGEADVPQPTNPQNPPAAGNLVTDEGDCGYVAGFVLNDGKSSAANAPMGKAGAAPAVTSNPGKRRAWHSAGKQRKSSILTWEILPISATARASRMRCFPFRSISSMASMAFLGVTKRRCSRLHGCPLNRFETGCARWTCV